MDHVARALKHHYLAFAILGAGLVLAFSSIAGSSAENCQQLEALATQYAGVALTDEQKQFKRKMVAWYSIHCIRHARR
jgi:hypothetical protein